MKATKKCNFTGPVNTSSGERREQKVRCPSCGKMMKISMMKNNEDGERYIRSHNAA